MDRKQFEFEFLNILRNHPEGYVDAHWVIKYDLIDREYYIRWTNGRVDRKNLRFRAFFKDGRFNHIY
jgi:hypothetical protein